MTCDDTVARHDLISHAKVAAAVGHERVGFFESSGIEQEGDTFAGGQFASFALATEPFFTTTGLSLAPHVRQLRQRIRDPVCD
jgi:hypothetical protein